MKTSPKAKINRPVMQSDPGGDGPRRLATWSQPSQTLSFDF